MSERMVTPIPKAAQEFFPRAKGGKKTRPFKRPKVNERDVVDTRSGGYCEVRLPGCKGEATQMHHKLRRSQGGKDTADNLLDLCDACHLHIHNNPDYAYANGWLTRSGLPDRRVSE